MQPNSPANQTASSSSFPAIKLTDSLKENNQAPDLPPKIVGASSDVEMIKPKKKKKTGLENIKKITIST